MPVKKKRTCCTEIRKNKIQYPCIRHDQIILKKLDEKLRKIVIQSRMSKGCNYPTIPPAGSCLPPPAGIAYPPEPNPIDQPTTSTTAAHRTPSSPRKDLVSAPARIRDRPEKEDGAGAARPQRSIESGGSAQAALTARVTAYAPARLAPSARHCSASVRRARSLCPSERARRPGCAGRPTSVYVAIFRVTDPRVIEIGKSRGERGTQAMTPGGGGEPQQQAAEDEGKGASTLYSVCREYTEKGCPWWWSAAAGGGGGFVRDEWRACGPAVMTKCGHGADVKCRKIGDWCARPRLLCHEDSGEPCAC